MGTLPGIRHQKAAGGVSTAWVSVLCLSCFLLGVFVVNRWCCFYFSFARMLLFF